MFERTTRTLFPLAAAALMLAGCDSSTGPDEGPAFDTEKAQADHEALDVLLSSDFMEGFRAMSAGIDFQSVGAEGALAMALGKELPALSDPARAGSAATRVVEVMAEREQRPLESPIISQFSRGKTFAYDPGLGRYAWDPELEGAPETGVRFILYEPGTDGKPDPSAQIGYADLIDEGDDSAEDIALRLVVVEGSDTVLDYRTTLDVADQSGTITVDGFLQGDQDRLDFQIEVTGSGGDDGNARDINFEMGLDTRDFLIQGSVSGVESDSGEGGDIDLLVAHGSDSFQVDVTGTDQALDGTVYLNGQLFVTVSGSPDDPLFTNAGGASPTFTETLVLRQIIDSTEDVFDFWEDLLDPVDELVILAIIF